jgi:hypothetical protein
MNGSLTGDPGIDTAPPEWQTNPSGVETGGRPTSEGANSLPDVCFARRRHFC